MSNGNINMVTSVVIVCYAFNMQMFVTVEQFSFGGEMEDRYTNDFFIRITADILLSVHYGNWLLNALTYVYNILD